MDEIVRTLRNLKIEEPDDEDYDCNNEECIYTCESWSSNNCGHQDRVEKTLKNLKIEQPDDGDCDCNNEECVGCFWPCETCTSNKCGHQCRINRLWKYEEWIRQGKKNKK